MKDEEKDKEIEELEKEIQRLELEYRKLLYEPNKYNVPAVVFLLIVAIGVVIIQLFLGGIDKFFKSFGINDGHFFVVDGVLFLTFVLILPALIKSALLFQRLNKLYRQLAEKKGEAITGFIGDSPVFLRRWSRKKPRRF